MDERLRWLVRDRLGAEAATVVRIDDGWDSIVFDVDDAWIVRVPRRPEVRGALLLEAKLLPLLALELPVSVPAVRFVEDSPALVAVGHPKLRGTPISRTLAVRNAAALAGELGSFLAALHASSTHVQAGFPKVTSADWASSIFAFTDRCEAVLRLLGPAERRRAEEMFAERSTAPSDDIVLIHGDLGPEHILCGTGTISGVIDWTDARVGDRALDFAWLLHAHEPSFGDRVLDAYTAAGGRIDPSFRDRALYFHRIGPWHEVLFGLGTGRDELVESGLAGVRARLP